ncbi:MAG: T9SS type A sorting domain-containing protein [Flavobacteriales bacterium]
MRPTALPFVFLLAAVLPAQAQISVDLAPYTVLAGIDRSGVPDVTAAPFDASAVAAMDAQRAAEGKLPYYSRFQSVNAGLYGAGQWRMLPNGDRLWRLRVVSPGAIATELYFDEFELPPGATMHVYDDAGAETLGAFTDRNNHESGLFTTALVSGEASTVEYYEPAIVAGAGHIHIDQVGHAYRMVGSMKSDDCEVDVRCTPEGDDWTLQKDGVVRLSVVDPNGAGWCSGSVVDNTAHDFKPYILTAFHCGVASTAANFTQWKAYFRYEKPNCGSGSALGNKVMTGCVKRADSNDGGGNSGSDFLLIEMDDQIPGNFFPYWNGWDASGSASTGGVGIHHPAGSQKAISTYTVTTTSASWGISGTHWRVVWAPTTNGWGVTEGGSSGSPLFNSDGLIMGTLTGGTSYCESVMPGGNNDPDFYGKLSYHWDSNPGPASEYLGAWLDPVGGGTTLTNGGLVGVAEHYDASGPDLYPNPAVDRVTAIYPLGVTMVDRIDVLDISGRLIRSIVPLTTMQADIDTEGLNSGTYFVKLVTGDDPRPAVQLTVIRD